ncbi:MAG TPA: TonB-dependent receptor [Steroidobacteraceae bacterium]|nr:TonB-dependent receptor [Steroidobacteraceae bacterium]
MRTRAFALHGIGSALLGTACLVTLSGTAAAQNAADADKPVLEEIVVTGIRASLQSSTDAKRESTGFTDSIFAEDIGKFPDSNIAESFQRIPGITITRETSGEGLNIAIRGLGTNFTKILLNDAPVAIASTGRTDSSNTNREVDLDLFPTELFTQLTVKKSSSASMLEGGAAGTVNMRSARPFDKEGQHLTFSLQGTKNTEADDWGGRGSVLASKTWDTFGVLIGGSAVRNEVNIRGFETIGWTNANLVVPSASTTSPVTTAQAQCLAATGCNGTGGGNWSIPRTVPNGAGNGLNPTDVINQQFLLDHNPGLTIQQIDNALIPRLGRPSSEFGTKDRYNGIVSLEYRPTDNLHFYVDSMYGKKDNSMERLDMNWVGRNGTMIPLNLTVDRTDCANGCVATGGTFANAQFFLEYRPYDEDTKFWGVNPGFDWSLTEHLKMNVQANKTSSTFHRESPTVLVSSTLGNGTTVSYVNDGGTPQISSNLDLNNPANFGWPGGRVNMQDEERDTDTKGVRANFTLDKYAGLSLRAGAAYDDVSRRINAFDNTQAWQNAICGDNPNILLPGPNTQPSCEGLDTASPPLTNAYPRYPGLGQGFSAGFPALAYQGSLIPNTQLASYLRPGPDGFITADFDAIKAISNYAAFHANTPLVGSSNTTANTGFVQEKTTGVYAELAGDTEVGGNRMRYTAGLRRVRTAQTIGGRISLNDPRNATGNPAPNDVIPDGSRYPTIVNFANTDHTYYNTLPSFEVAYNLSEQAIVRGAASRTITRPDPNAMLPGLSFATPSADVANLGNSELSPFKSENLDIGFEYYTGREGYVGLAAFRKRVVGFTTSGLTTVPFSALAQYGVTFGSLTKTQQDALIARGGPDGATVIIQQQVNASGALTVNGMELNWVQPLDFLLGRIGLDGFGLSANLTLISQASKGAAPAVAIGVSPHQYNGTLYYEKHGFSARLSTTFTAGSQTAVANQNGIPLAALFSDNYEQWDFSSGLDVGQLFGWGNKVEVTLDAINLFNKQQRGYFQFENAAFTNYIPGRQFFVGVRGSF